MAVPGSWRRSVEEGTVVHVALNLLSPVATAIVALSMR